MAMKAEKDDVSTIVLIKKKKVLVSGRILEVTEFLYWELRLMRKGKKIPEANERKNLYPERKDSSYKAEACMWPA